MFKERLYLKNDWLYYIKNLNFIYILLIYFIIYGSLTVLFALIYFGGVNIFNMSSSDRTNLSFCECVYFSIITTTTVGYGDITPLGSYTKMVVGVQVIFISLLNTILMSIITVKILWADKNMVYLSKEIMYDIKNDLFCVRIINISKLPTTLSVKCVYTMHAMEDEPALTRHIEVMAPIYLDKYDRTCYIENKYNTKNPKEYIYNQLKDALKYENRTGNESRFNIAFIIEGTNTVHSFLQIKKYFPKDFVQGDNFDKLHYKDKKIKYKKLVTSKDFYKKFNSIINRKKISNG